MRAGALDKRITLQKPTYARGDLNELAESWTDVATVWAEIIPNSGRQYFEAEQASSETQGMIRIRYRSDIEAQWRFTYNSRTFRILSIVDVKERNRELLITYKEALD